MTLEQDPKRAKELFLSALERPVDQREAFVRERAQGDEVLVAGVEALLDVHAEASQFLVERDSKPPPLGVQAGDTIDRYRLLQEIGEGGFGSVWMAEQTQPVRRKVALKIIKLGMDTKQVIARFEAERQALALMDHPNIAKVLDGGATESGRPYFVMELIKGVPITEYCNTNHLTTPERLELFTLVCHAVQHAHSKGVIHRDLKPSNVMVTLHDGVPIPKVIDFGIAKATHSELTDKTMFTEFHQLIGTPLYMSPEQAEMSGLDIDTRADVYSLGVLLYELLTGSTPFTLDDLIEAGLGEVHRLIREHVPLRPSTRVSTLDGEGLTAFASQRSSEGKDLNKQLRGDLDWIVMRTLEKDRARRYPTAEALAADVRRHLANEPVEASPPSSIYRLSKLVRRNRGSFIAAAIVVVAVLCGSAATGVAWLRAERAQELAQEQRSIAEQRFAATREFAGAMLEGMDEHIRDLPGASEAREYLVRTSLEYLDTLTQDAGDDVEFQAELAAAYLRLGDALGDPFAPNSLGDYAGARVAYGNALALVESLLERFPGEDRWRELLGLTLDGLGTAARGEGKADEALLHFDRSRALCQEWIAEDGPNEEHDRRFKVAGLRKGHIHMQRGEYEEALALFVAARGDYASADFDETTASSRALHERKVSHGLIGNALSGLERLEEALEHLIQRARLADIANERFPNNPRFMRDVGQSRTDLAELYLAMDRPADAMRESEASLAGLETLLKQDPSNAMAVNYLAHARGIRSRACEALADTLPLGSAERRRNLSTALDSIRSTLELVTEERLTMYDPELRPWLIAEKERLEARVLEESR